MTTATTTGTTTTPAGSGRSRSDGFGNVVRSEWTKLRSVRSTPWSLAVLFVLTVGLSAAICWGTTVGLDQMSAEQRATIDPTSTSLAGISLGQLVIAVLGVLTISSEYSTGGIRTTFTAVPQRLRLVAAKGLVFLVVAWIVGTLTSFVSFFVGQPILATAGLGTSIGAPHVLRAVFGGGLYLLGSGMFGYAVGALVRKSAAAITVVVALLLVLPGITSALPGEWGNTVRRYFTSNAGQGISYVHQSGDVLGPWAGYGVFTLWWLVLLAIAAALIQRRDA